MGETGRPLGGAIIGCGFVSKYHIKGWSRIPGVSLNALCDLNPDALKHSETLCPSARVYRDTATMLDAERDAGTPLDFVEICTRPESHRELVELAASRGVHVLCQKPAAPSKADLEAMIDAGESYGIRVMIHENWRYRPWYRVMKTELESGSIGRPIRLRIVHRDTRALRPNGFADQPYFISMPRLILFEMGCHLVDTARYLVDEIENVTARIGRFGLENRGEDVATLQVGFAGGSLGLIDISWCSQAEHARAEWALNETVIEGTRGSLRLRLDGSIDRFDLDGTQHLISVKLPKDEDVYVDGYSETQKHFIAGLLTGMPHETSASDTLRTMEVVWKAYESAESGRTLPV